MITFAQRKPLLVATHNEAKRQEIINLLSPYVGTIFTSADLQLPDVEETEMSFAGNASLKARSGAMRSGHITLADDSGFGVVALKGKPGIFSSRFAETDKGSDYDLAICRLIDELGKDQSRHASFTCALVLARPDGDLRVFEATCDGTMIYPGRGTMGFGYDPYFIADGQMRTFGEMESQEKHALSHRGKAMAKLVSFIASPEGQQFIRRDNVNR